MLSEFVDSTQMFWHYFEKCDIAPPDISLKRGVNVGTVAHDVLLEGHAISEIACRYPDTAYQKDGKLNGVRAKKFREMVEPMAAFRDADYVDLVEVIEKCGSSELGSILRDPRAKKEEVIHWDDPETGLACRCKPDLYVCDSNYVYCHDLKFTTQIRPRDWEKVARRFKYWLQDSHYSSGLMENFKLPVIFQFWVIETTYPYRIAKRMYSPTSKDTSRDAYHQVLRRVAACRQTNDWRDEWMKSVDYVEMSPWDLDSDEPELEGFEDGEET